MTDAWKFRCLSLDRVPTAPTRFGELRLQALRSAAKTQQGASNGFVFGTVAAIQLRRCEALIIE